VCWVAISVALGSAAPSFADSPPRSAAPSTNPASACRFESAGSGTVAKVLDGRSFFLDDGREIRLAGLDVPPVPRPTEDGPRAAAGDAAKAALEAIVAGRTVTLSRGRTASDRYGRTLAYAEVTPEGSAPGVAQGVAQAMLAGGHARVSAPIETMACASEFLGQERAARAGKLGLWADPYYLVLGAESGARLLAEQGHFSVVEGKVLSVRESGGTIYVNFGRRWSEALTVTILKRNERIFTAAGVPPAKLEQRRIRVRGWIDERNGPRIEANRPEQIEIADLN
jgi:endonuclease YncB( thermonuclease family)